MQINIEQTTENNRLWPYSLVETEGQPEGHFIVCVCVSMALQNW